MKHEEIRQSESLIRQFDKLPVAASELGLAQQVQLLRERPNRHLYNLLAMYMSRIEQHLQVCPFVPPPMPLNHGEIHIGDAITTPVSISFVSGQCSCTHLLFSGPVNTGKTYAISRLAVQAAAFFFVLLIDSRNQFSQFPEIRTTFQFTSIRDWRLNPFDEILGGLEPHEQDQVLVKGLKRSYDWQHAEREVNEAIQELRAKDSLHMYGLLNHLRNKRYPPGTNRGRYRDTAVLSLSFLLDGTFPLFSCTRGMDIAKLLSTTPLVLEINSVIGHQNYIIRMIFDLVYLLGRAGKSLDKPILIIIDEAQDLCERGDIGEQLRTLRHSGIHLCLCVQNP